MSEPRESLGTGASRRLWQLSPLHVPAILVLCALFVVLNHSPVGGSEIWRHVEYGRWILDHATLPTADPVLEFADGMRVVAGSWLSQVVLGSVDRAWGAEGLSLLFTLTVLATWLIVARAIFLRTRSLFASVGGALVGLVLAWPALSTVLPASFAALCLALLLWLLASANEHASAPAGAEAGPVFRWRLWVGAPLVLALWANVHESFFLGALLLACGFVARVIEVGWRERSVRRVLADRRVRAWLVLAELGVVATLVNPYGIELWVHVSGLADNPLMTSLPRWRPLVLKGAGGRQLGLAGLLLALALRRSRLPIRSVEVLQLGTFGIGWALHTGMALWFAPLFAYTVTPHLAALRGWPGVAALGDEVANRLAALRARRSGVNTVSAVVLALTAFAVSPASAPLLTANSRDPFELHGPATPVLLAVELRRNPPEGITFAPDWWADWLVHETAVRPLVNRNLALVPARTWSDYQRISAAQTSYERLVERYTIATAVVDKARQPALGASLRRTADWELAYEDSQALVFHRSGQGQEESE
jgi:hypothetical protein